MAVDGRMRRRSRRMRAGSKIASACGADLMRPRGGIRGLVKSSAGSSKSADRGIPTHAGASGSVGHIVKPGAVDSDVKPSSADSAEKAWIYIRGCRINRAGLRFNSKGDVYVPDSEDDESSVEVAPVVAANGATDVDLISLLICRICIKVR